jgi:hypothetical protein
MCAVSECVRREGRLGRHSRFLGRVVVGFRGFTSDGRNDGGDGVLGPSIDGSGITCHQQGNNQYPRRL